MRRLRQTRLGVLIGHTPFQSGATMGAGEGNMGDGTLGSTGSLCNFETQWVVCRVVAPAASCL